MPSEMAGAEAPVLPAFFVTQSRAARTLSSHPALSWQTVIVNPPSAVSSRIAYEKRGHVIASILAGQSSATTARFGD